LIALSTPAPWVYNLPAINATLNGTSAVFLLTGYFLIRSGKVLAHKTCMLIAFGCSAIFLVGYLYYHFSVGLVRFGGEGWIRPVYFTILTTHTILAIIIVPLVIITLSRALQERFDRHRAIAIWTFPLWMYVGVTGVIVYFLLYRIYPPIMPANATLVIDGLRSAASAAFAS
jgi:putative membrane protein